MEDRETLRMLKYGESKTTRIMMATVPHVTSWAGRTKYQAAWFLLNRVYSCLFSNILCSSIWFSFKCGLIPTHYNCVLVGTALEMATWVGGTYLCLQCNKIKFIDSSAFVGILKNFMQKISCPYRMICKSFRLYSFDHWSWRPAEACWVFNKCVFNSVIC